MDLIEKGAEANIKPFKQLKVTGKWTSAIDFDMMALIEYPDKGEELVYFKNKGDVNVEPYIMLDKDSGVGDTAGANEENLFITKLEGKKAVHLFMTDYKKVQAGDPGRFTNSDVTVSVMDDNGDTHTAFLDADPKGNVVLLGSIVVTPIGAKFVNSSTSGKLEKLKNSGQFLEIVRSAGL